jgi:hypothetical protein
LPPSSECEYEPDPDELDPDELDELELDEDDELPPLLAAKPI